MKKILLVCLVLLILGTSCGGQNIKPLSERSIPELEAMLDEAWLSGEEADMSWKATAHYTRAIVIELELQRRKK